MGLVKGLGEVEKLRQLKNYQEAETRLKSCCRSFPATLGSFSLWARRPASGRGDLPRGPAGGGLNRALANYRLAVAAAKPDTDRALLSHAYEAMGRILAFMDKEAEASKNSRPQSNWVTFRAALTGTRWKENKNSASQISRTGIPACPKVPK